MKKLTAILLALLMMLCTVACNQGEHKQKALESLKAAAEKTKSAKSFVLDISVTKKMGDQSTTNHSKRTVRVGDNGACTMLIEDDNGTSGVGIEYYSGKEGYVLYGNLTQEHILEKHIYSETVDLSMLAGKLAIPTNPNFLTDFCSHISKISMAEDGGIIYSVSNITADNFMKLWPLPELTGEGSEGVRDCKATLIIDKNGYLTERSYSAKESENGQTVEWLKTVTLSRLGEEFEINEPEFIKKVNEKYVVFHEDGYVARYEYAENNKCYFVALASSDYNKMVNIPVYRVLSEVEGVQVKVVNIGIGWWNNVNLEKLVLPECIESICVLNYAKMENTELFLSCSRDSLKKNKMNFYIVGDVKSDSFYGTVKAVYYSGEWKDVNGVPTPNK